ncbi:hypothetical protein [Clostridium sulfidigenes]|uniref:hypothetical protein n=1 Tax=Clostridium sulfidigenes TaxID=318464 RepID=UPI003F894CC7
MTNKQVDFPDIQEFLKITRNYVRQLKIVKKNRVKDEYTQQVINNSIKAVIQESQKYI